MFGMSVADTIRVVLMAIFILVCICLTVVVLMPVSYTHLTLPTKA